MMITHTNQSSKWRRKGKQFIITWPQCDLDKEQVEWTIVERWRLKSKVKFMLTCKEEHKNTSGWHLHALVIFEEPTNITAEDFSIKTVKKTYVAHVEGVRSVKASIEYIKKDGDWIMFGECPTINKTDEKRDKIAFMREHNIEECMESGLFSLSEIKNAMFIKERLEKTVWEWPRFKKRQVFWYWGPTGTGKTRRAVEEAETMGRNWTMISGDLRNFMNGYNGEDAVIIDDIRKGTMRFEQLLRILDGYRLMINVKGGYKEWKAERIWITCPQPPEGLFRNEETLEPWDNIEQLTRRIDRVREFGTGEETEILPAIELEEPTLPPAESEPLSPIPQASTSQII